MKPAKEAKVSVILSTVKIRVEDLSYLKGLMEREQSNRPICRMPDSTNARLRILGLIHDVEIGVCPDDLKAFNEKVDVATESLKNAMRSKPWDWGAIYKVQCYNLRTPPQPRTVTRITEAGKKLLAEGSATVVVQRSCR